MKNFNVKKVINKSTDNPFTLSEQLSKTESKLIEALHIMQSIINNPDQIDYHNKKIKSFYKQFI